MGTSNRAWESGYVKGVPFKWEPLYRLKIKLTNPTGAGYTQMKTYWTPDKQMASLSSYHHNTLTHDFSVLFSLRESSPADNISFLNVCLVVHGYAFSNVSTCLYYKVTNTPVLSKCEVYMGTQCNTQVRCITI